MGFQTPIYSHINNNNNYAYNGNNYANNGRFRGQIYAQRLRPEYNRNPSGDFGFRSHVPSNQRPFQQPLPQNGHLQQQPRRPKANDYRRWEVAKNPPPPTRERFSVLSYNILADYLANNHWAKLYYHIPRRFLDWEWRKKSISFELGLWSPDIMSFQEVDKFNDLEEDLRNRGYMGIWKMRTGNPVDGCAIFWQASRFKLVHEEHIEFNKLGMRDNVAQICVLESLIQNHSGDLSASSKSSEGPNKVVVCNIHVLYNPRRGEIKLGQVRVLLDRAQAVSKIWNDAPIVICGDFNCTPKSALYNFISEQKLDLSELERDKVSGQASAEIPPQIREFRPYSGVKSNPHSVPTTAVVKNMGSNSEYNASSEKQLSSQSYSENEVQATAVLENRDEVDPESSSDNVEVQNLNCEMEKSTTAPDNLFSNEEISEELVSTSMVNEAKASTLLEGNTSDTSVAIEFDVSKNAEGLSFEELDKNAKDVGEDSEKFLSDLHLGDAILEDLSLRMESVELENTYTTYDPSLWTPMEIATATGNADCTFLEHPLMLKSSYAEVEGSSETRDSSGEPVLTSYNKCFMGTVDYIWRSEGLQTLRVLAPLTKNAVQWTRGFPTRKWGSDHIALVSELAFTKDSE